MAFLRDGGWLSVISLNADFTKFLFQHFASYLYHRELCLVPRLVEEKVPRLYTSVYVLSVKVTRSTRQERIYGSSILQEHAETNMIMCR